MTLHVHEFGPPDGPPLLALHGLTGHGARFADLSGRLPEYRIIAPDLRGHGRSTMLPPWRVETFLNDIRGVLDEYKLPALPVLGHSLGGALAVWLARAYEDRVSRLILLEPGTGMPPEKALATAESMLTDVSYATVDEARADRRRNWPAFPTEFIDTEITHNLTQRPDSRLTWRYHRAAAIALANELTRSVPPPPANIPALLVHGTRSTVVSAQYRKLAAAICPLLTITDLDAGHAIYYERPAETAKIIGEFLTQE